MSVGVYLVCYDIANPERLRKVFRVMRGAGERLQYSVFRCVLTPRSRELLRAELEKLIDLTDDQVLFVDLGPETGRAEKCFTALGRPYRPARRKAIVV